MSKKTISERMEEAMRLLGIARQLARAIRRQAMNNSDGCHYQVYADYEEDIDRLAEAEL